jgi:hypothetical protein
MPTTSAESPQSAQKRPTKGVTMPTTPSEYVQSAQEQTLKTVRDGQQAIVEAVRAWADAVERIVPPTPALPFSEQLPSPQQVVETSFDFAEQLLKTQREFTENVLAAAAPVLTPKKD